MSFRDYSQKMYDWLSGNLRPNVIPIDANGNEKFTPANPGTVSLLGTALLGTAMEVYGASLDDRPAAASVAAGTTFTIVDSTGNFDSYISDGSNWLEV